ncbi:MAG TPA: YraN family protein [Gammaproteobacteria bacterium]|nr:YraN family protein [Gammaproteobacteria bacterium]
MSAARAPHLQRGDDAESLALRTLAARGLKLIERNYRCPMGEIDLICEDGDSLVFVEVRYRRNWNYGLAAETVNHRKQVKLIRTARQFLQRHRRWQDRPVRFDVVAIQGEGENMTLDWIPDAFQT